jgi:hypothetical protein
MKYIALHTVWVDGKAIEPGESFEIKNEEECKRLLSLGAAVEVKEKSEKKDDPKK